MKSKRKIREFCKKDRYSVSEFARHIGCARQTFYQIMAIKQPLPKKYWKKIVEFTAGFVTFQDLVNDYFEYQAKKISFANTRINDAGEIVVYAVKS